MSTETNNIPTGDPTGKQPVKGDYLSLFLNGYSTEEIKQKASELGADVVMPGMEQARAVYKNLSDDEFNSYYTQASASFDKYKRNEYNGNIAPAWKYAQPNPSIDKTGRKLISGGIDKGAIPNTGIMGHNMYGERTMTEEQIASARGKVYNDRTKSWEEFEPGILDNLSKVANKMSEVLPAPLALMIADREEMYMAYDEDNDPYWRKNTRENISDQEKVRSAFGDQAMTKSWIGGSLQRILVFTLFSERKLIT